MIPLRPGPGSPFGTAISAALLACLLNACLPIPNIQPDIDVPAPDYRIRPAGVDTRLLTLPGHPEPHTPPGLNQVRYLVYSHDEPVDTVLVLMPGIFGGATSFDPLARQLVASIPFLQVWVVDRRSNVLEDHTGFRAAQQQRDPSIALGYYLGDEIRDPGYRPLDPEPLGYMAHWGLDTHLRDLHALIVQAGSEAERVILGGHSLGAGLVSFYAALEIEDADPGAIGADFIDGLWLIDGAPGRTGAFERDDTGVELIGFQIVPTVEDLIEGRASPFIDLLVSPSFSIERAVEAHYAHYLPDELAPERLAPFPITNLALAGLRWDDDYALSPIFSATVGEAVDADFDGNLLALILTGADGLDSRSVAGVAEGAEFVSWTAGDPETERTDLGSLVASYIHPETDYVEWYFPSRLAVDVTLLDLDLGQNRGFAATERVTVPTLAIGAERGLIASLDDLSGYLNTRLGSPVAAHVLPGLTHIDIVAARDNPAVVIFSLWLEGIP